MTLNNVQIASLKEGGYEDIMVWVITIGLIIISGFGAILPLGVVFVSVLLFWMLYDIPKTIIVWIADVSMYGTIYIFAFLLSVWRTYKFDVFKTAHGYKNGDALYDNINNVKDAAFDFLNKAAADGSITSDEIVDAITNGTIGGDAAATPAATPAAADPAATPAAAS